MAHHSVGVAYAVPGSPGFARPIARRSPPRPTGTSSPLRSARSSSAFHRQTKGTAFGSGVKGIRSSRWVHNGAVWWAAKSA